MPREQLHGPKCCGALRRRLRWVGLSAQQTSEDSTSTTTHAMLLLWFMVEQLMQIAVTRSSTVTPCCHADAALLH
jgi:hypothetical protein